MIVAQLGDESPHLVIEIGAVEDLVRHRQQRPDAPEHRLHHRSFGRIVAQGIQPGLLAERPEHHLVAALRLLTRFERREDAQIREWLDRKAKRLVGLPFLFLCAVGMAFAGLLAIPFMLFGLLFWVITLPFRLFFGLFGFFFAMIFGIFRVFFGIVGGILGFILAPVGLLILALLVIGGVIVGLLSLLAPLVPVALLALLVWAIYRLGQRRPTPTF